MKAVGDRTVNTHDRWSHFDCVGSANGTGSKKTKNNKELEKEFMEQGPPGRKEKLRTEVRRIISLFNLHSGGDVAWRVV